VDRGLYFINSDSVDPVHLDFEVIDCLTGVTCIFSLLGDTTQDSVDVVSEVLGTFFGHQIGCALRHKRLYFL
jgi:hypothetical protein